MKKLYEGNIRRNFFVFALPLVANAIGKSSFPMIASLISNILNISGNYILIKHMGMEVEGTAYATAISAIIVSVFYVFSLVKTFKKAKISIRGLYYSKEELSDSRNSYCPKHRCKKIFSYSKGYKNSTYPNPSVSFTVFVIYNFWFKIYFRNVSKQW